MAEKEKQSKQHDKKKNNDNEQPQPSPIDQQRIAPFMQLAEATKLARSNNDEDAFLLRIVQSIVEALVYSGDCARWNAEYTINSQIAIMNAQAQAQNQAQSGIVVPK